VTPLRLRPALILVTTVSHGFQTYLAGQPRHLCADFRVTLVTSPGPELDAVGAVEGVPIVPLAITRKITPLSDLASLLNLYRFFRRTHPDIVQTYSPKAGLVGMWAARLAGVPVRVHGIIGMPLMEAAGAKARILRAVERLIYHGATDLTCNSVGLRQWVQRNVSSKPITVVGNGSVNGVDLVGLRPPSPVARGAARRALGVDDGEVVFTFVGRMVPEKGIVELLDAFQRVHARQPSTRLLLVGDFDIATDTAFARSLERRVDADPAITHLGWTSDVRPVYQASDVVVLPSYREGLPNVLLEAAAHGLALIATDITGCKEVVHDGSTGLLVPMRDPIALASAMVRALDGERRAGLGRAARALVEDRFDQREFCRELTRHYRRLLTLRSGKFTNTGPGSG
jgi:glycosyltransferase involved in cell wall biosynthesis